VGWLDLFNLKYGIMINGIDTVIITLLDALHGITPIKVCTEYELDGRKLESWPIQHEIIKNCKPIYREFEGWNKLKEEEWSRLAQQGYDSLPETMKVYLQAIKQELNIDIAMVSIGPKRNDTIVLDENLF
jgi:adenylosuccinate synthase